MTKKLLSLAMTLLCVFVMSAQQPQVLDLDPNVKSGKLPNGLTYFIRHNAEPKGKANFYIAQKVGSTLENEKQLGLAHFLEHMAFNGTKHYPGKDMLNYLQANGIRFGADINAYTGFDETVYNIDNVPVSNTALMDSVLLVLRDWSCDILLEDEEIDAERNVINEEWRMRNDASTRLYTNMLKKIYKEPQYHQMPIGSMEVVMNFPYSDLRDYYHTWYRPDQQGIIIVGDFNADEMEQKVIALFSDIPMPENAPERTYPMISDNEEPIFFSYEDPELKTKVCQIYIKTDKLPFEYRNTDAQFVNDLVQELISSMINERLSDAAQNADCDYAYASVGFNNFLVAATKDCFQISVLAKDEILPAAKQALEIVTRACKTGFTPSEYQRACDNLLSDYEKAYNERENTNTSVIAQQIIRHFIDNTPYPGIENEYMYAKMLLGQALPLDIINQVAQTVITPTNQVITVYQPSGDGLVLPTEEATLAVVEDAFNKEYEAYADEVITEPMIAKLPKKGKVTASKENPTYGTTELTLSNGVKVIVKTTDFKNDEINLTIMGGPGKEDYDASQADNLALIGDAFECVKFGKFDNKMLAKYLAGKNASLGYGVERTVTTLEGGSTVKDFPTLMELVYTAFTNLNPDKDTYETAISRVRPLYENMEKNPDYVFMKAYNEAMMHGNPMNKSVSTIDLATIDGANYDEMFSIVKNSLANAADYTFIFTGNIDVETIKPYLEQYVASLPSKKKATEYKVLTPMNLTQGEYVDRFDFPMDTPSTQIFQLYSGYNLEPTVENAVIISLLGNIIDNRFTEIIREKEGAAYSPSAFGQYSYGLKAWQFIAMVQTNSEKQARVLELIAEIWDDIRNNGATAEEFNKVKGASLSQYENNIRTNDYWDAAISNQILNNVNIVTNGRAAREDLTLEKFNSTIKNLYDGKNFVEVMMTGVEK